MRAERRELTAAQEVLARVLVDAVVEDILEEKAAAASQPPGAEHDGEPTLPSAEAACR